MLGRLLKSARLGSAWALVPAAFAIAVIGCGVQMVLGDISHVAHVAVSPKLPMGKMVARGAICTYCHADAKTSDKAGLPGRDLCWDCHQRLPKKEKFALGGDLFDEKGTPKWRVPFGLAEHVRYPHGKHAAKHDCAECHGNVKGNDFSLVSLAATLANCRRCHVAEERLGNCAYCHDYLPERAKPHSHEACWGRSHGISVRDFAGGGDTVCLKCHSPRTCVECHRKEEPRDHSMFWKRAGHALGADIDHERCVTCHTEERCVSCHVSQAPPRSPGHAAVTACTTCHVSIRSHVVLTERCLYCHR
ncbi:MAG: hypothetical protein ACYS9X_12690 [Planctomycetota bacterium]|jgi:predicted CXXCH cytochrome family protein